MAPNRENILNDESARMENETVASYFKALFQHLSKGTEEDKETLVNIYVVCLPEGIQTTDLPNARE